MSAPEDRTEPRKRVLSLGFWLVMALSALCLAGAVAVARLGPRLFPADEAPLGERTESR